MAGRGIAGDERVGDHCWWLSHPPAMLICMTDDDNFARPRGIMLVVEPEGAVLPVGEFDTAEAAHEAAAGMNRQDLDVGGVGHIMADTGAWMVHHGRVVRRVRAYQPRWFLRLDGFTTVHDDHAAAERALQALPAEQRPRAHIEPDIL